MIDFDEDTQECIQKKNAYMFSTIQECRLFNGSINDYMSSNYDKINKPFIQRAHNIYDMFGELDDLMNEFSENKEIIISELSKNGIDEQVIEYVDETYDEIFNYSGYKDEHLGSQETKYLVNNIDFNNYINQDNISTVYEYLEEEKNKELFKNLIDKITNLMGQIDAVRILFVEDIRKIHEQLEEREERHHDALHLVAIDKSKQILSGLDTNFCRLMTKPTLFDYGDYEKIDANYINSILSSEKLTDELFITYIDHMYQLNINYVDTENRMQLLPFPNNYTLLEKSGFFSNIYPFASFLRIIYKLINIYMNKNINVVIGVGASTEDIIFIQDVLQKIEPLNRIFDFRKIKFINLSFSGKYKKYGGQRYDYDDEFITRYDNYIRTEMNRNAIDLRRDNIAIIDFAMSGAGIDTFFDILKRTELSAAHIFPILIMMRDENKYDLEFIRKYENKIYVDEPDRRILDIHVMSGAENAFKRCIAKLDENDPHTYNRVDYELILCNLIRFFIAHSLVKHMPTVGSLVCTFPETLKQRGKILGIFSEIKIDKNYIVFIINGAEYRTLNISNVDEIKYKRAISEYYGAKYMKYKIKYYSLARPNMDYSAL